MADFLKVKDVAASLGVSDSRIYQLLHTIPHIRRGGSILFPRKAWEAWLDTQNAEATGAVIPAAEGSDNESA